MIKTDQKAGNRWMSIFTDKQQSNLFQNGLEISHNNVPCALFMQGSIYWLFSELYNHRPDVAYGLTNQNGIVHLGDIDLLHFQENYLAKDFVLNDLSFETKNKIFVFKAVADEVGKMIVEEELFNDIFVKYQSLNSLF